MNEDENLLLEKNPSPPTNPSHSHKPSMARTTTEAFRTIYGHNSKTRHAVEDHHLHMKRFGGNYVSTTRYTILNFFPKCLMQQFSRLANVYFLIAALIRLVPFVSPGEPLTSILPLVFVVTLSMIREGIEDIRRFMADKEINARSVQRLGPDGHLETIAWKSVRAGDILYLHKGDGIPADCVLLSSSEEEGVAYIETSNLDGETNLKIRTAIPPLCNIIKDLHVVDDVLVEADVEAPNWHLYDFLGRFRKNEGSDESWPLGPDQLLLRGSVLRNTRWVLALAVYTGKDTKLVLNSFRPALKRSTLETRMNYGVLIIFAIQMIICSITSGVLWADTYFVTDKNPYNRAYYPQLDDLFSPALPVKVTILPSWVPDPPPQFLPFFMALLGFLTSFAQYDVLIPISLYVTLEIIKVLQSIFITSDLDMWDEKSQTCATVKTTNLNEELGVIDMIFCDKTGTLTENIMELKCISIEGVAKEVTSQLWHQMVVGGMEQLKHGLHHNPDETTALMLQLLVTCHTVVASHEAEMDREREREREEGGGGPEHWETTPGIRNQQPESLSPDATAEIVYESSSPDEAALVSAAASWGVAYCEKADNVLSVRVAGGLILQYRLLQILPFSSERGRMSVIIQDMQSGSIFLHCKGADSMVLPLCRPSSCSQSVVANLQEFAAAGLRTLVCASKQLDQSAYNAWAIDYEKACSSMENRITHMAACTEQMEQSLTLLGATAIEDKLQEGVAHCIEMLRAASVAVWILTGDKVETAVNIARAAWVIKEADCVVTLRMNTQSDHHVSHTAAESNLSLDMATVKKQTLAASDAGQSVSLVLDGHCLAHIMAEEELYGEFLSLSLLMTSVVACRLSPAQKASLVNLMRQRAQRTTAAIGDGANDVAMITAAHVGLGISGREGLQAARAADFSIAQFRFLEPLLLKHGSWSLWRNSTLVWYSFYKNTFLVSCLFLYNTVNGGSGKPIFEDFWISLYNVIFTALPISGLALFDRHLSWDILQKYPRLYLSSQSFSSLTLLSYGWMLISAFGHALCICGVVTAVYLNGSLVPMGLDTSMEQMGITIFSALILIVQFKVALLTQSQTALWHLATWGECIFYFGWACIWCLLLPLFPNAFFTFYELLITPPFWASVFLAVTLVTGSDLLIAYGKRTFFPGNVRVAQEIDVKQRRLVGSSAVDAIDAIKSMQPAWSTPPR
jgi:phospholipid-translocating P-type ATPase (flippase)